MKTFVSALTLGLILAFSAPAFAAPAGGDTSVSKPAPKAGKAKTAESKTSKPQNEKSMY